MMKTELMLIIFLFTVLLLSCNTTDPPVDKTELVLKPEDVSCTEAWIELTTTNLQLPTTLTLIQDGETRKTINITTNDTLLYVDSLLPNQTYKFKAEFTTNNIQQTTNEITATTMDTTSHNFTFDTWTFGDIGSSTLYDVAIINENNIWAVGDIKIADTSENGYTIYNAVHWDGNEWTLHRIMFYTICGQQSSQNAYPVSSIIDFSENEIWVAQKGDQIAKMENGIQTQSICMPWTFSINKIWGTSSNDLYVVGNNGNIAHYNGSQWSKIESGTDVDIQDIWGISEDFSSESVILCAASNIAELGEHKILNIRTNNKVDSLFWGTGRRIHSIWFDSKNKIYTAGGGVFTGSFNNNWIEQTEIPLVFTERVRGKGKNDLFVVGHFGLLVHFNGISWKEYPEASEALVYTSLDYKNNLMVTVGYTQRKAVIQFLKKH